MPTQKSKIPLSEGGALCLRSPAPFRCRGVGDRVGLRTLDFCIRQRSAAGPAACCSSLRYHDRCRTAGALRVCVCVCFLCLFLENANAHALPLLCARWPVPVQLPTAYHVSARARGGCVSTTLRDLGSLIPLLKLAPFQTVARQAVRSRSLELGASRQREPVRKISRR